MIRKFGIFKFWFSIGWIFFISTQGCIEKNLVQETSFSDGVLGEALHAVGLEFDDLSIQRDYLDGSNRLEIVRYLLKQPLSGEQVADRIVVGLSNLTAEGALNIGGQLLGLEIRDLSSSGKVSRLSGDKEIPRSLAEFLAPLIDTLVRMQVLVEAERSRFSLDEQEYLQGMVALIDPESQICESESDSLLGLAQRIDLGVLSSVAKCLLKASKRFIVGKDVFGSEAFRIEGAPIRIASPAGLVVIGGLGADTYREAATLVVDLGGNDCYEEGVGVASEKIPVSICIDLDGADLYKSVHGRGLLGVGILLDLDGDDDYEGAWGSQGSGLGGVGILEDWNGNDRYRAGLGSQGFGLYGIGIFSDLAGKDQYFGDLMVQGVGGPGGVGIFCEGMGDDFYEAGGRYRDFREEGKYFQSMAQGFGFGYRPLAWGGVGILYDVGGNDVYQAAYFAQGSAHWGGMGILIDRYGDDRYEARRYAQGCGSHLAVGLLQEGAGDDVYSLWGVGQGCGNDLSVGVLNDRDGNDQYRGVWLVQGVGNANGIGLLDEKRGNDLYIAERKDVQGYGNPSRNYGSIGLLVDRMGKDVYRGLGGNGRLWKGGMYGAGIDAPLKLKEEGFN